MLHLSFKATNYNYTTPIGWDASRMKKEAFGEILEKSGLNKETHSIVIVLCIYHTD
jgi:hypothetical protein